MEKRQGEPLQFQVLGMPLSKARHRSFLRGGKICSFDPQSKLITDYKIELAIQMRRNGVYLIQEAALHVELTFYLPIPSNVAKSKRIAFEGKDCRSKKDIDNLCKFALDGMNKIVYDDDHQITRLYARKCYSQIPRTDIIVTLIL